VLARDGRLSDGSHAITIEQGYEMGRPSLIRVEVTDAGGIRVGGQAVIVGEGAMYLP